jgi:hypothetical protein
VWPAAWRFDDLTENDKNELFKNSIRAYIEYLEELKEKEKKIAMKIIFHVWRTCKDFEGEGEPL